MPPLIVEFTGLPGAGKTTITNAVISELTKEGYDCFPSSTLDNSKTDERRILGQLFAKLRLLFYLTFCLVKHNHVTLNALRYAFRVTPFNLAGFRRVLMLVTRLELISSVTGDDYDFLVFDEGLIQNIWSIVITGNPPSKKYLIRLLRNLLEEITLAIILVDVDIDIAVKRIEERSTSHSRFDRMSPNKAEKLLLKNAQHFECITGYAVALKKADRLKIEGSSPIEDNVNAIVHFVDHFWRVQNGVGCL